MSARVEVFAKEGKKFLVRIRAGIDIAAKILLAVSLVFGAGCAKTCKYQYNPNTALIDTWEDSRHREPFPFAYAAVYRDGCTELRFVAAHHGSDETTFQLIKNEFEHHTPKCVVLEGFSSEEGFSPQAHIERTRKRNLAERSESGYAMKLAVERGIPFIGGEPSNRQMLNQILEAGYTAKDLQGFEALRTITGGPGIVTDGKITLGGLLSSFIQNYGIADRSLTMTTEEEFYQWYKQRYGREYDEKKSGSEEESTFSDSFFKAHVKIRDANIVGTIATALTEYDRVLVVYGAGHRMELERVLQDMLGKPKLLTTHTFE